MEKLEENKQREEQGIYKRPSIEILYVEVERGFALSPGTPDYD